jgi:hypothetical protein
MTSDEISILLEIQNHGDWIKVFIPYSTTEKMTAHIQNDAGDILKMVKLIQGNNAIDISNVKNQTINLKIETPYETISKQIKVG